MRWLLTIALVLHLAGLPAVGGVVCASSGGGRHSCCERDAATGASTSVSAHCGCAMTPPARTADVQPVGVAPDSRDGHAVPPDLVACERGHAVLTGRLPVLEPVSPDSSGAAACLSGGGFRC